jgi:hypothetical protein
MLYEQVKDNKIMLVIDGENTRKRNHYKKKIKDIVEKAKAAPLTPK